MILIEDLTDVTLAIEDTDEDDEDDEEDLTDVTLVSDDTYWKLDWCYSSNWGSDGSYHVMKVVKWWKNLNFSQKIWESEKCLRIQFSPKSESFLQCISKYF